MWWGGGGGGEGGVGHFKFNCFDKDTETVLPSISVSKILASNDSELQGLKITYIGLYLGR